MRRESPRSGERERKRAVGGNKLYLSARKRAAGWISGGERALRHRRNAENEKVLLGLKFEFHFLK